MNALPLRHPGEEQHSAQSWAFSVLLHGIAVGAAIVLLADLSLVPQRESFKWDVALVETPTPEQVQPPAPPAAKPEPVAPAPTPKQSIEKPVQKARPVRTVQPVIQQQVRQVQPVERVTTPSTQQPVQQADQIVMRTAETIAIPRETVPAATEGSPAESRQVIHEVAVATAEPQQIVHETVNSTTETRQVTETAVAAVETRQITQETAVREPSQPVTEQIAKAVTPLSSDAPSVVSKSIVESAQPQASTTVEEQPMVRERATSNNLPARSRPTTKADYGWLAEALWSKVERLKRYPAMARMNHWEGKVVLRAVIRDTGELLDLQVAESSGHAVLDRDAIEVMRRASPITLKHSLGQSQVVLHIPISYKLQ